MHPFERFLQHRTAQITAYRFARHNQLIDERREFRNMARLLEIKGLGADVAGIRSQIADIKTIAKDINTEAPLLRAEMADLRDQIREHRADLRAEAGDMGNGGGEMQSDPPPPPPTNIAKPYDGIQQGSPAASQQPGSIASTEPHA